MTLLIAIVTVLANAVAAGWLICYRRGCSRYRPALSLLAYFLIVFSGGQAIDILFNGAPVTLWDAGLSLVVAALVIRARGNVSYMLPQRLCK